MQQLVQEQVDGALAECLARGERDIAVAAFLGNTEVLNACGTADATQTRPMTGPSTPYPVFSVTKAFTATALHLVASYGLVDYDAPVAEYWPEFGVNGKSTITVRQILSHRSGVPQMPADVTPERMCDWDWMVSRIAEHTPEFDPGTRNGYQSLVFGWLVGELVRRVDPHARPFADFVREEICVPLDISEFWLGAPPHVLDEVPELEGVGASEVMRTGSTEPSTPSLRAMPPQVAPNAVVHNRSDIRSACVPGAGAIMTARSGVRLFAMLANLGELDGTRLLPEDVLRGCLKPRSMSGETDVVFGGGGLTPPIGIGGYWLAHDLFGSGHGKVLCHPGAGGSIGWANVETGLSVVVCHSRMFAFNPRTTPLEQHPFFPIRELLEKISPESFATYK